MCVSFPLLIKWKITDAINSRARLNVFFFRRIIINTIVFIFTQKRIRQAGETDKYPILFLVEPPLNQAFPFLFVR